MLVSQKLTGTGLFRYKGLKMVELICPRRNQEVNSLCSKAVSKMPLWYCYR